MIIIDHTEIFLRYRTDAKCSLCSHYFCLYMVSMSRCTPYMNKSKRSVFTFVHGSTGLIITGCFKFRMLECGARRIYFYRIRSEEPAHQINIMDCHINENTAACGCKTNGSLYQGLRIDSRSLNHIWCANCTFLYLLFRICIRRIKSSHKSQEKCQLRMTLHSRFRHFTFFHSNTQRLIGKYMFSRIQSCRNLPAVFAACSYNCHSVYICFCKHLPVIRIYLLNSQLLAGVIQFRRYDRTGCCQLCIRYLICQIIGMYFSKPAQTGNTYFYFFHSYSSYGVLNT